LHVENKKSKKLKRLHFVFACDKSSAALRRVSAAAAVAASAAYSLPSASALPSS